MQSEAAEHEWVIENSCCHYNLDSCRKTHGWVSVGTKNLCFNPSSLLPHSEAALLIRELCSWGMLPFVVRPSIFESAVCLLRLSIEKDGRSTCRQKTVCVIIAAEDWRLFFFPPLAEPSSGCVIWHTVLTPDALPNTTLCIGTGLCIPIGPHQVSASCQRTLWHVGCRGQTSNHWTSNQWTTTLTPELLPTTTNG